MALGNQGRPSLLDEVEKVLWHALFDMANPASQLKAEDALKRVKDDIPWDSLDELSASDCGWFRLPVTISPGDSVNTVTSTSTSVLPITTPLDPNTSSSQFGQSNMSLATIQAAFDGLPPAARAFWITQLNNRQQSPSSNPPIANTKSPSEAAQPATALPSSASVPPSSSLSPPFLSSQSVTAPKGHDDISQPAPTRPPSNPRSESPRQGSITPHPTSISTSTVLTPSAATVDLPLDNVRRSGDTTPTSNEQVLGCLLDKGIVPPSQKNGGSSANLKDIEQTGSDKDALGSSVPPLPTGGESSPTGGESSPTVGESSPTGGDASPPVHDRVFTSVTGEEGRLDVGMDDATTGISKQVWFSFIISFLFLFVYFPSCPLHLTWRCVKVTIGIRWKKHKILLCFCCAVKVLLLQCSTMWNYLWMKPMEVFTLHWV